MTERTVEDITKEHNQLCFEAGVIQYRIDVQKKDVQSINLKLKELNLEAAKVHEINMKAEELKKKAKENLEDIKEEVNTDIKEVINGNG